MVIPARNEEYRMFALPWLKTNVQNRSGERGFSLTSIAILEQGAGRLSEYRPLTFRLAITLLAQNIRYFQMLTRTHPEFVRSIVLLAAQIPIGIVRHTLGDESISDLIERMQKEDCDDT